MFLTLFAVSIAGGFFSGFLGIGGAVVMIPLMLTVPPILGVGELTMKTVAGLSMIQVLFSSFSGIIIHHKNHYIHYPSLIFIGIPMGFSAFFGSYISKYFENSVLLYVFLFIISISFVMLSMDRFFRKPDVALEDIKVNRGLCITSGSIIGIFSGMVGVGGGFFLVPFMAYVLKIPFKATIGTSLGIILIGAMTGAIGKIVSFQVEFALVLPVIIGSLISARIGAKINKKTSPDVIRRILMGVIVISVIQVVYKMTETF